MIPQETVNLILDTARIEDVVSDFVSLKRRGADYVACCPFHNEKTPSFHVSPSRGIFKCFGCGAGGNSVKFVMEHEHCSYVEALKYIAKKYNIEIVEKDETPEEIAQRQHNESLILVSEFAEKFYMSQLDTIEGKSIALAYYKSRGLEDSTIGAYRLGWAPKSKRALMEAASAAGYNAEYLLETGLCIRRDDGILYDRFFDRVVFPIHSVSGRTIGFGCRTLRSDFKEAEISKYVNSHESEIFVKRNTLYGIDYAKKEIAKADKAYLVEGYLDVLSMHQLGITNVVASSGTSLTVQQIRQIRKFTQNITIMYDGDSAGIHAAIRGLGMVLEEGMNVKIILLPDGNDPDDFARRHTLAEVRDFIAANEKDFIEFKTELLLEEAAGDPLKKAALINDIADTIALIPDPVKRTVYVDDVAMKFRIESGILFNRIARAHHAATAGSAMLPSKEEHQKDTSNQIVEENRTLARAESDIVSFLLTNGRDELDFDINSPYYSGDENDKPVVADFIRSAIDSDGTRMVNTVYRDVYDRYFELYDSGLGQDEILRTLYDSSDPRIQYAALVLSTPKYQLSVESFEKSLTTKSSWLVIQVPKALLYYADRRLQDRITTLRRTLGTGNGVDEDILTEIMKLQAAQRSVKKKLGREKEK